MCSFPSEPLKVGETSAESKITKTIGTFLKPIQYLQPDIAFRRDKKRKRLWLYKKRGETEKKDAVHNKAVSTRNEVHLRKRE